MRDKGKAKITKREKAKIIGRADELEVCSIKHSLILLNAIKILASYLQFISYVLGLYICDG